MKTLAKTDQELELSVGVAPGDRFRRRPQIVQEGWGVSLQKKEVKRL